MGPAATDKGDTGNLVGKLTQVGYFPELSRHFMKLVDRLEAPADPCLLLAAGLVSRAAGDGHICLDLRQAFRGVVAETGPVIQGRNWPDLEEWRSRLRRSRTVGCPGDRRPLILGPGDRLYLHRYFTFETRLADHLIRRTLSPPRDIDRERLRRSLSRHFPPLKGGETDWQKMAAVSAAAGRLAIISGGPGTGKTTVVARILAILAEQAGDEPLRMLLTAPTGKAAARLADAIRRAQSNLPHPSEAGGRIPTEASTIHRLLKWGREGRAPAHHAARLLPADVVVVDEASMVDLALMFRLVDAVPESARLIVLGDRNQLASVEAGSVFGDLCHPSAVGGYAKGFAERYQALTGESLDTGALRKSAGGPLSNCITVLQKNYRFSSSDGIGRLASEISAGNAEEVLRILEHGDPSLEWRQPGASDFTETLTRQARKGFSRYLASEGPEAAIDALDRYRVLCALRGGPFGVATVNRMLESSLIGGRASRMAGAFYPHRPVVINRNDYSTRLFNGDCGVTLDWPPGEATGPRVWFPGGEGTMRAYHPARLPDHETVFAMTIHKSQGSEFDEVFIVLPVEDAPVLTRELLYTAVTRARRRVVLWADRRLLMATIARKLERSSGLADRLWPNAT
ncbi:MAG: exodeoxyribonuclease V subunit alpha [Desulfobacterales bacterium]